MANAGTISVTLSGDLKQFKIAMAGMRRDLKSTTGRVKRNFGKVTGEMRKVGIAAGLMGAAVGVAAIKLVGIASDAEETQSKFNVVFSGMEDDVNSWAESFAADVGRANQDIKRFSSGIADVLKPMGLQTGLAADMSKQMVQLALDVASFNNRQDEDVIRAFTSALTGERESLKTLGIVITEADVKQEALNAGIIKGDEALTKEAKALATINLLFKNSKDAQGDLIRTQGTFANQMKRVRGNIKNIFQDIGEKLLPVFTDMVTETNTWIKANEGLIKIKVEEWVGKIASGIKTVVDFFRQHGDLVGKIFVAATIAIVATRVATLTAAVWGLVAASAAFVATPIGAALTVLAGGIAIAVKLAKSNKEQGESFKALAASVVPVSEKYKETAREAKKLRAEIQALGGVEAPGIPLPTTTGGGAPTAAGVPATEIPAPLSGQAEGALDNFGNVVSDANTDMTEQFTFSQMVISQGFTDMWGTIINTQSTGIGDIIKTEMTGGERRLAIWRGVTKTVTGLMGDMTAKWVKNDFKMSDSTKKFLKGVVKDYADMGKAAISAIGGVVGSMAKAAAQSALSAAKMIASLAGMALAGIKAFAATVLAFFSFLGPFAPAAAAGTIAAGVAIVSKAAKGFQGGGRPGVGEPALVGEGGRELFVPDTPGRILTNAETESVLGGGGGGGITIHATINTIDGPSTEEWFIRQSGVIARGIIGLSQNREFAIDIENGSGVIV